jgi:KEOPS complex subunit Cgi121
MELLCATAEIEDLDSFVAELDAIGEEFGCAVQAFDARYVAGSEHLANGVRLANRATERSETIARERSVEILLYVAGRRQINRAFEIGVSEGECEVVIVVDVIGGEAPESQPEADASGDGRDEREAINALSDLVKPADWKPGDHADSERITDFYEITDAEREATDASLEELVCERVALLVVEQ